MELPFSDCDSARLAVSYVIALARCTHFIAVVPVIVLSALGHYSEGGNGQLRSHQELQPEVQLEGGQDLPACLAQNGVGLLPVLVL